MIERNYTTNAPLSEELDFLPNKNYLFELAYLTTLLVEGDKSAEFLQGQLSCNLHQVNASLMQQGVLCNLKGRVLTTLDVIFKENRAYSLVVPTDLLMDIESKLLKPAQFSRVQLKHDAVKIFGLFVQSEDNLRHLNIKLPETEYQVINNGSFYCYKIDPMFYVIIIPEDIAFSLSSFFIENKQYRGSLSWHALQLKNRRVEIYPSSQGIFLPHRLDLHKKGYLSFDKGCYKGQEIIARMHYRSTPKHKLECFFVRTNRSLTVGLNLYDEEGLTVIGEVVDYCNVGDNLFLMAASVLLTYESNSFYANGEVDNEIECLSLEGWRKKR